MTALEVIKEGYLQKKSRHIGAWRVRWTVFITDRKEENVYRLCTFSQKNNYRRQRPTEYIRIDIDTEIKVTSWTGNEFYVSNNRLNEKFLFTASSPDTRDEWVQSLLLKTDVGSLSEKIFEDINYHHISSNCGINNGSMHRSRKRRRNSRKYRHTHGNRTEEEKNQYNVSVTVDSKQSQSHIDKMKADQLNIHSKNGRTKTKGFVSTHTKSRVGCDIDITQKIMHWIEMEILLKTGDSTYFEMIISNEFDHLKIMQKITNKNLSEIGIENMEHRMQIIEIIGKIPLIIANL